MTTRIWIDKKGTALRLRWNFEGKRYQPDFHEAKPPQMQAFQEFQLTSIMFLIFGTLKSTINIY
jgi:hypothetical protein